MAYPRLGPTAPRTGAGFTPVGTPPPPRALPPGGGFRPSPITNQQNLQGQFRPSNVGGSGPFVPGAGRWLPGHEANRQAIERIGQDYTRPSTLAGQFLRVLGLGENVGAGFVKGTAQAISEAVKFDGKGFGGLGKDLLELIPAWGYVSNSFPEAVKGVGDNLTYEQWIKESNDPDSFLYRHSMIIGLGLSIFGDPLTYVSFGATGPSKAIATNAFTRQWMDNAQKALTLSRQPGYRGKDISQIAVDIGKANGSPFSISEALDQLKRSERAARPLLGKGFARGGQGMRFAGMEVPGTRALGQRMAGVGTVRGDLIEAASPLIPNSKVHKLYEDIQRTTFIHESGRLLQDAAKVFDETEKTTLKMFADNPKLVEELINKPSRVKRGELVIRSIFKSERPPFVPDNIRSGLLKGNWKPVKGSEYGDRLSGMRLAAFKEKSRLIKLAAGEGYDKRQIAEFEDLWTRLVDQHNDPIDVVSKFSAHVGSRVANSKAMRELLNNPLFARIQVKPELAEELSKLGDELNEVGDKLFAARKKVHEKGITPLTKGRRAKTVRDLEARYASVKAAHATAKETHKLEVEKAGGRVLRPGVEDALGFDWESGMPLRMFGQNYIVPEPIHHAIQEMRNPALLDKELERGFRIMNWTQNKWKILATSPNPQFHTMNLVGGMWNNLLAGVYSPLDYVQTMADMYRSTAESSGSFSLLRAAGVASPVQLAEKAGLPVERMGFQPGRFTGPLRNAEQVGEESTEAIERGVPGGFMPHEVNVGLRTGVRGIAKRQKSGTRLALQRARQAYGAASVATFVAPDEWVPDEIEAATMGGLGALALSPEFLRTGGAVATDVETVNRMTPFRQYGRDRYTRQFLEGLSITPPTDFGKWLDQTDLGQVDLIKETMFDIGASVALRYQFDYSKLTSFERNHAKTWFPFYTFYKNNFVLQLTENPKRPRFMMGFDKTTEAISNYAESQMSEDDPSNNPYFKELLPEYFDKLHMFQVPVPNQVREILGLPRDQPLYLNPKLPFTSMNMFPPFWELFNDDSVTPTPQKWMQVLAAPLYGMVGPFSATPLPGTKILIESTVGQQLGLARPIDFQRLQSGGFRNSFTEAPAWTRQLPRPLKDWLGISRDPDTGKLQVSATKRYVIDQLASPFINGLGEPLALASGEATEKTAANTVAWMTGIRLTPVDPLRIERGWLYRMENFLEGQRAERKDKGLPPDFDNDRFLRQVRAATKVTERAWDRKQEELYGGG